MADAFGIAGSALGIVSLGLQLYGGIATYFDALEGRGDDLASARAQLDSLRHSLMTIQSVLPPSASATASTGSSTEPPIVGQCQDELDRLETLLQELAGSGNSCEKLKDRVKTLRFPFRRDNLMKLEDRLHKTNAVFQTALSVFHLNKSLGNEQKLANVEAATTQIPTVKAKVAQVSMELQGLRTDVTQISVDTNNAATMLHSNDTAVTSLADNFGAFAPEAISRLGEVRQSLDTVARQDDIRELSRISENNTDILCRVRVSVAQLAATTESKLALVESSAQNLASSEERILQRLSNLENLLGLQGAERPTNSQVVLRRVLAKPSQAREIFDGLSALQATTSHSDSSFQEAYESSLSSNFKGPSCTCLHRKVRQGTSRSFGPFWLRTETSHDGHSQYCQMAKWRLGKQRRWFELTTAKRSSFWSWAVAISFAITTGAGGLSISPNINIRPVVDEQKSPVFRVLTVLEELMANRSKPLTEAECSRCLSVVASTILTLYQERKAFPYEVNTRGESAIYKMVCILGVGYMSREWQRAFGDFVMWAVVEADLPSTICDFSGRTPVMEIALKSNGYRDEVSRLLSTLYVKTPESVINCDMLNNWETFEVHFSSHYSVSSMQYCHLEYGLGRIQPEIFGYGPICTAIFADYGEERINDLIDVMDISETSSFGQTPLHLAVGTRNLNVLAALLRSPHIPDVLHLRDVQGNHAIDYAVRGSVLCENRRDDPVPCSECSCSDALDMLLCVESCFDGYLESIIDSLQFAEAVYYGSLRTAFLLISKLKLRRDQLKRLALAHLDDKDIARYKLDRDGVLDYYGIDVVERLNDMGIDVPTALENSFFKSSRPRSIYHNLSKVFQDCGSERVAQLIFDFGFHDTDEPDELGYTPLMMVCEYYKPDIILWFVGNGADFTLRDPGTDGERCIRDHVNPTVAQQVVQRLPKWRDDIGHWGFPRSSLLTTLVPVDVTDDCKCYCTADGCSPASILFWELWGDYNGGKGYPERPRKSRAATVSEIILFLKGDSLDLMRHRHVCLAAIRMLTFETLGISHTCGCRRSWPQFNHDDFQHDDFQEIWDEEVHLIGRLEELQTEFETRFDELGIDLSTFLSTEWHPRLENVLWELDGYKLSEAERTGAEALGVRWQPVTQEPQQEATYGPFHRHSRSLEDFLKWLRGIGAE